jgi:flavin-dependent dehydrogenase
VNALPASTDVFVIGGGPAGLAAAMAARRRGFDVTLADWSVPPIDKACGEGVMPGGVSAARALGIPLEQAGGHLFRGIRFCQSGAAVQAAFPHGPGLGLRRTALHGLMVECAARAGVRLAWGVSATGLHPEGVHADGRLVRARWIVGADGSNSNVRRWAGLDACRHNGHRFGFRRHYRVAPWSEFMEIHWGHACQLYITPVSEREMCVALISADSRLRLDDALPRFPAVAQRLAGAEASTRERGAVSCSRRLKSVCRGRVALVGDASGSVDAITGEGLCLLFQQAEALGGALEAGDPRRYEAEHRRIGRRPEFMAGLMLLMNRRDGLRSRAIRAMSGAPRLFEGMLTMHSAEISLPAFLTNSLCLGWRMLTI